MKPAVLWVGGSLVALSALFALRECKSRDEARTPKSASAPPIRHNPATAAQATTANTATDPAHAVEYARIQLLENPGSAAAVLATLRNELFRGDQEASARAISSFLRTGRDAPTGMGFAVGPDGVLAASPTLRSALLNWHPSLDPLVALEMAREILQTTESADEYAVALRNLAWNDLHGDLMPELSAAFHNLLARREWRTSPTAGYLESFDVAVALGDTATFRNLAEFAAPQANVDAIVRAASMSMDRMILRNPGHLSQAWRADPQWLDAAPLQRASLLSRLDIMREDHRVLLLEYLASDRVTEEERDYFESLYPNGNHLHGHRLVTTQEKTPTIEERAAMDRAILATIDNMMEHAPAKASPSLQKIRNRLASFVTP